MRIHLPWGIGRSRYGQIEQQASWIHVPPVLREHLRHHEAKRPIVPTYCALRTRYRLFVHYATGEEELYDYRRDPHELENLLAPTAERARTAGRLRRLTRDLCDPQPPGMAPF